MLMSPRKGKTAIHGCHCLGDMAVRMCEVLARLWDSVCVPLALSLSYHKCRPLITREVTALTRAVSGEKQIYSGNLEILPGIGKPGKVSGKFEILLEH